MLGSVWVLAGGDERGGAAVHLDVYARSVMRQGFDWPLEWHLMGEGWLSERLRQHGLSVHIWPKRLTAAIHGMVQHMRQTAKPMLLHAHGPRANLAAYGLHRRTGVPWVTTLHSDPRLDFLVQGGPGWLKRQLNRVALGTARGVFAVNETFASRFGRRGMAVPNAVWLEGNPGPSGVDRRRLRQRLGVADHTFLVGSVARLDPVKNLPVLIEAIAAVPDRNVHLVIAGDGPERSMLEHLAQDRAPERVHFLGFVDEPAPVYKALDVHALVSRSEGTGLVILEAAYHGIPTIATDIPGMRRLIRDGETGLLVPVGSASAVRDAVLRLQADPDLRHRLVTRFQAEVLPQFQPQALREAYAAGYARFLRSTRA